MALLPWPWLLYLDSHLLMFILSFLRCSYYFCFCYRYDAAKEAKFITQSNDSDIATPSKFMNHLIAVAQAKREQACSEALPHSITIEETDNSIMFISSPSPI